MEESKKSTNQTVTANLSTLEKYLEDIFLKKAPALPENAKETIVKYGPYITILVLVLMAPALMLALGLSAFAVPFGGGISALFLIITLALELIALPGLFKRSLSAWRFLLYASLVNIVYSVLSGSIVSGLIGTAISFYFLFQVKSYYK